MPRIIDADELMWHKSSLVEPRDKTVSMGKPISYDEVYAYRLGWNEAIDAIIENAPTVDAEPVIRCKDCRFYNTHDHRCVRMNHGFKDDFFCAWGERREDGQID